MSNKPKQTADRRSSVRNSLKFDPCVSLVLSPAKLPLTSNKLQSAVQRSKEVADIFGEKTSDLIFSDLNFLKKDGNRNAVANIKIQDYNFLINNIIFLASKLEKLEKQSQDLPNTASQSSQDSIKVDLLSSKVCDLQFEISKNTESIKNVDNKVRVAQSDLAQCKSDLEAAVEDKAESLEVEKLFLENTIRMGHFEQKLEDLYLIGTPRSTLTPEPVTPPIDTVNMGQGKKVTFAEEPTVFEDLREVEVVTLDESVASMPPLEEDTPTKLSKARDEALDNHQISVVVSDVLDKVVEEATEEAATSNEWIAGVNRSEKFDNHFSMVFFKCRIPKHVRRLETVRRLERKHIEAEGKSIYPQFHMSTVKYIQSLRPRGQSWSEPYNLKVVFKSEHVRQHMMDAAVYAGLLTRPHMSKRQFEHFRREQIARYSISGTNTPGTPFLSNGGFQLQKPHPATEMNMKLWERRYWRSLGTNPLQRAYDRFKQERDRILDRELKVLNGARASGQNTSEAEAARPTARTAPSASRRPLMRSFTSIYRENPDTYEWENPSPFPCL